MNEKNAIRLSYVMTTFNKLAFLKITLPLLIKACEADEEIVIVDGGSTDGTAEFLEELLHEKKIHRFISEKDNGEAHGTNKAILLSRGELIKIITDDDVFSFRAIRHCRGFMLNNPTVDILGFDGYGCHLSQDFSFEKSEFILGFRTWLSHRTPFLFCGLSFLIRRTSLSYLGLFSTGYTIIDMEYSIRVSALRCRIAFYEGSGFVNIVNPGSNSQKFYSLITKEKKQLARIYPSIKNYFNIGGFMPFIREQIGLIRNKKNGKSTMDKQRMMALYSTIVNESVLKLESDNANLKPVLADYEFSK